MTSGRQSGSRSRENRPRGPLADMMSTESRVKDFWGTVRRLLRYMGSYKWAIILVIFLAIVSTVFAVIGPKILGNATTILYEGVMAKMNNVPGAAIDFTAIGNIMLLLTALYIISAVANYIQGLLMSNVSVKLCYHLRQDISVKIKRLPLKYYDKKTYGEVLSYITNDVETITQSLNQGISQVLASFVMLVGIVAIMFYISWLMTLVTFLMLPISLLLVSLVVRISQKYFKKQQDFLGHVNGHVEEMYGGHSIVKAYNGEERSIRDFNMLNGELYDGAWKAQFLSSIMMPILLFVNNLGYVGVCILGSYLMINGVIAVGDIQAFIQYVRQFTQPVQQVAMVANVIQQTVAAAERIFEFVDEPEEIKEPESPVALEKVDGRVTFENVSFGYDSDNIIIHNFSADVKPGQKVAIVGPTGAGKTTMVKLLMRYYEINNGAIKVDGVDISNITRRDLRANFAMVLQDTWLINDTIRENIRYGNLNATDEQVIDAAKTASADHFIRTLPQSYDMVINEDATNVSQGQKQLLTIARAVLADPKILILDEATSSVDTRTEKLIQSAMEKLMKGKTSFIIAHRLSTIRNADIILVMRDGEIVEQGTHDGLLAQNGFFASLYNSQFEQAEIG